MFQEWLKDYKKLREENNMSEEEIINRLTNPQKYSLIEIIRKFKREGIENFIITKPELLQGLIDLYNKEKEKNKKAKRYILEKQSIQYKYALSQIECEALLNILEE